MDSEPAGGAEHGLWHSAYRPARPTAACAAYCAACSAHCNARAGHTVAEPSHGDGYAHIGCSTIAPATTNPLTTLRDRQEQKTSEVCE